MNEVEMLALGDALARTSELVRPDECIPFRDYLERVLGSAGPGSRVPVTGASRVVLYRREGPALDVLTRGVIRRICLN
jgi:hypothetical protein